MGFYVNSVPFHSRRLTKDAFTETTAAAAAAKNLMKRVSF